MMHLLHRIIRAIEREPFSLPFFCVAFLSLIFCRIGVESFLDFFAPQPLDFLFFEFTHTFLFFLRLLSFLIPVVRFAGAPSMASTVNILLFGFLIILTPPIIDTIVFHGSTFWSFYKFDSLSGLAWRFLTFFGDRPDVGITYGVRAEVAFVTIGLGVVYLHRLSKTTSCNQSRRYHLFSSFHSWHIPNVPHASHSRTFKRFFRHKTLRMLQVSFSRHPNSSPAKLLI